MQTIIDAKANKKYVVKKLHTLGVLRQRLVSFGIVKGVEIELLNYTSLKNTYELQVGKMNIALRKKEAEKIEVDEIDVK